MEIVLKQFLHSHITSIDCGKKPVTSAISQATQSIEDHVKSGSRSHLPVWMRQTVIQRVLSSNRALCSRNMVRKTRESMHPDIANLLHVI